MTDLAPASTRSTINDKLFETRMGGKTFNIIDREKKQEANCETMEAKCSCQIWQLKVVVCR